MVGDGGNRYYDNVVKTRCGVSNSVTGEWVLRKYRYVFLKFKAIKKGSLNWKPFMVDAIPLLGLFLIGDANHRSKRRVKNVNAPNEKILFVLEQNLQTTDGLLS